jgi:UDP-D-galactose:(glucosyl)LPS alpha-1,3-D-galactosyltransferase
MSIHGEAGLTTSTGTELPPIVCCIDDGFVPPLCVLMQSLAVVHREATARFTFIIIFRDLSDAGQRSIREHGDRLGLSVDLRQVPPPDSRYPEFRTGSDATYTRLAIPEVIPDHRIVLYLDVDLIILRDLRPLLTQPLAGAPFAAVLDPTKPLLGLGRALPGWPGLGLQGDREYFNNGVTLLDVDECRRQELFLKASRFLIDHPDNVRYWDQDAMNWASTGDWLRLDRTWNTFALSPLVQLGEYVHRAECVLPLGQLLAEEETAAVLHFAGPRKPWMQDYPAGPHRDRYLGLLRMVTERSR